jgi:hypothetical protein
MSLRHVDVMEPGQGSASRGKVVALCILETNAQRLGHARAPVIRRTAADAEDDAAHTLAEGVAHEFAGAARRRDTWVALVRRHQA